MSNREKSRRAAQSHVATNHNRLLADYYSRQELADELGLTLRSLERWAWLRKGPTRTKIGNRIYYHRAAVEAWLAEQSEVA